MNDIIKVIKVRHLGKYRLHLEFSDGSVGERDLADVIAGDGPIIAPLSDENMFRRVFLQMGTLAWPNGFDLDSIALHDEMDVAGLLHRRAA